MNESSTRTGGEASHFTSTKWSLVLNARASDGEDYRRHLESLIRLYWKPVYSFLRRKRGRQIDDAKDLTQSFFVFLLGRPFLDGVDPSKGRFRTYLLACLQNFLLNEADRDRAQKRGGGEKALSLDFPGISGQPIDVVSDGRTPDQAFQREWELTVLREATRLLAESYAKENREIYFQVFEAYDLDPGRSYGDVGAKLDLKETQVTNYLAHARRRFRTFIEEIIRQSVATEEDVQSEIGQLFRDDS